MEPDEFTPYERGLEGLLKQINRSDPRYKDAVILQMRLEENIARARLYGDSDSLKSERFQILGTLNQFAQETIGVPFDELCRGKEISPQLPSPPTLIRGFPGLRPYNVEDKDSFFGRNREIQLLVDQIERDPIVVVNGLSGCGKTSLIRAGVIPCLQQRGYLVLYAAVFENIIEDIRREIWQIGRAKPEPDYVASLELLKQEYPARPIVLIVDQFEQALSASHPYQALEEFLKGIPRLLGPVSPVAKIVIVVRADWLYFLEASTRQFYPQLSLHSYIFTLDPLTPQSAREVIVGSLQKMAQEYDEAVVDEILRSLQTTSIGPSVGPYIQPIQLQIVLRTLMDIAWKEGCPGSFLTEAIYRRSGGVDHVLRNHLIRTLSDQPEAWRLLARFVAPDHKTSQTLRRSALMVVPAAGNVETWLNFLVAQGLLEVHEAPDKPDVFYRLAHDYLVEAIVEYLDRNPDQQGWKLAEDWLASGILEWQASLQRGDEEGLLLERNRYLLIYQHRDKLPLSPEARQLLLLTALRYGHEGLGYWLSRSAEESADKAVVDSLTSPRQEVREAALRALAGSIHPPDGSPVALDEGIRKNLHDRLAQAWRKASDKTTRYASARALWLLQRFDKPAESLGVARDVFGYWLQEHALQVLSYLLTVGAVLLLVGLGLYVRERLQGQWTLVTSLKGGEVALVFPDPLNDQTLYALTQGGPGPWEGVSLFVSDGEEWHLRGRDLSKGTPTAIAIAHDQAGTRAYIALYSIGILRSEDGGETWQMVTQGLPSRGLSDLVADSDNPMTLYAATDDWRGVLRSQDGGTSWDFYDYGGEIFGSRVSRLAYTRAGGGALIAGLLDGRILFHRKDADQWEAGFGLSRGAITALAVARSDPRYAYAGTTRGFVLRSQDGGFRWDVMGRVANEFEIHALAVAPDNPLHLFVGAYGNGGDTIWESIDGGETWRMVAGEGLPRVRIRALVVTGTPPYRLAAATTDGLFTSRDGGTRWEKEPLTAPLAQIQAVALSARQSSPLYVAVGGSLYVNDGSLYRHPAGEHSWILGQGLEAESVRAVVVDPENPQVAYAGVLLQGNWSVFRTEDGGKTWKRTASPAIEPVVPDTLSLAIGKSSSGQSVLYAGTMGCGIFRTTDAGKSWDTFGRVRCDQAIQNMPADAFFLAVDPANSQQVCAASGQQVSCSEDGGLSWRRASLVFGSPVTGLTADAIRPDTFYLITQSSGFWYSGDGGQTWQRRGERELAGAALTAIAAFPGEAGRLAVGSTNGGVWVTPDRGLSWHFIRENLPPAQITGIATSQDLKGGLVAGTPIGLAIFTPGHLWGPQQ